MASTLRNQRGISDIVVPGRYLTQRARVRALIPTSRFLVNEVERFQQVTNLTVVRARPVFDPFRPSERPFVCHRYVCALPVPPSMAARDGPRRRSSLEAVRSDQAPPRRSRRGFRMVQAAGKAPEPVRKRIEPLACLRGASAGRDGGAMPVPRCRCRPRRGGHAGSRRTHPTHPPAPVGDGLTLAPMADVLGPCRLHARVREHAHARRSSSAAPNSPRLDRSLDR